MLDMQQVKYKIINFLKENGPSLPVKIAKEIEMSPVFASAILSELLKEGGIKSSHLKIGASALYFIPGQEQKLEEYKGFLKTIERETVNNLQERKVLEDEKQDPAIRVALRSIKDFAVPFRMNEKVMWRYAFSPTEEIKKEMKKDGDEKNEKGVEKKEIRKLEPKKPTKKKKEEFISPFEQKKESEFFEEVKGFLKKKNSRIIEEIQIDKKEIVVKISTPSSLGDLNFLVIAKDKKSVTTDEINSALQRAIYEKMPCLYLIRKEPTKKLQTLLEINQLIKLEVLR
jgi:DNA-binding Lrp family transcriptional regulator